MLSAYAKYYSKRVGVRLRVCDFMVYKRWIVKKIIITCNEKNLMDVT